MSKDFAFLLSVFGAVIVLSACSPYPLGKIPPSVVNRNEDRWLRSINNEAPAEIRQIAILCGWSKMGYGDLPRIQKCIQERGIEPPEKARVSTEECGGRSVEIARHQQCMLDKGYVYMDDPIRPLCDPYNFPGIEKLPACQSLKNPSR